MLIAKICLVLVSFLPLYEALTIYQQSHYKIKEYFLFYIKKYTKFLVYTFIFLIYYYCINDVKILTIFYLCSYEIISFKPFKIKLKFTKRMIRLIVLSSITNILIFFNIFLFLYLRLVIILVFMICNLFEHFINLKYLNKATKKRSDFDGDVIAITGSFGKTTTKHFLSQVLDPLYPLKTPRSYNTPMGISLTLNQENLEIYNLLILEMGASKVGDIKYLSKLFRPNIAILVQIGNMHLNGFENINNIINEKMSLVESLPKNGFAILNYENEYIREYKIKNKVLKFTYGFNYGDFRVKNIKSDKFDFYFKESYLYTFKHKNLNMLEMEDFIPSIILGVYYGISFEYINSICMNLKKEKNRLEEKIFNNFKILDDSFNSNLKGSLSALFKLSMEKGIKYLITPGFVENDKVLKKELKIFAQEIKTTCDYVFIIHSKSGDMLYETLNSDNVYLVNNFKDAYNIFINHNINKDKVLLIENDLPDIYERMKI